MALRKHYGINNFRMLDLAEEKLNQFEISKLPKLLQDVLVNQAIKRSKFLCTFVLNSTQCTGCRAGGQGPKAID